MPPIQAAFAAKDITKFEQLTGKWAQSIKLMDALLGTDSNFLLGSWQAEARAQAANRTEAAALRYDLRSLVSLWDSGTPDLQDYARREWNGLVGDYYGGRWQLYFFQPGQGFADRSAGRRHRLARVRQHLGASGHRLSEPATWRLVRAGQPRRGWAGRHPLTATAATAWVKPGGTAQVTVVFANSNLIRSADNVGLTVSAPAGYVVRPATPTTTRQVPVGGTFTAKWTVAAPANAPSGSTPALNAGVSWRSGSESSRATAAAQLLVTGDIAAPYTTVSTNNAGFAQSGDNFSIAGGGVRTCGVTATNSERSIAKKNVLADDQAVITQVTSQDNTSPYARAGLVASNDLSASGSAGYATIGVTPGHGCVFGWDRDGNGTIDSSAETGGFAPTVYVRLGRHGDQLNGSCSSDGKKTGLWWAVRPFLGWPPAKTWAWL
ncbi:alpha-N-acetylglucosaminidase C-terminal domain-containing protein [Fodinicola feengrottensis]|uniref:alpha-N-acetylglucosaminidase C-terminal domain-containing protein n=1 Tax=Fodinicola feengrottensis TaxID=435914 RepID=UPI0024413F7F|nr:alpha-N-acetylglucosaminidase C-terminal domain-containing protein [Fodinicola feengrottensis]